MSNEDRPPKIYFNSRKRVSEAFKGWLILLGLAIMLFGCFYPHYLVRYIGRVTISATGGDTSYLNGLAWSSDSRQLAIECVTFSHYGTEREKSYYLMQADGRNLHQLANPTELPWPATFQKSAQSPDGRKMAVLEPGPPYGVCRSSVYVMDSNGPHRRRVDPVLEINLHCPEVAFGTLPITATISIDSSQNLPAIVEFSSGGWPQAEYPFRESQTIIIPASGSTRVSYKLDSRDVIIPLNVTIMANGMRQSAGCQIRGGRLPKFLGLVDLTIQQHLWLPLLSMLIGAVLIWPWAYTHRRQKRVKGIVIMVVIIFGLTLFFFISLWYEFYALQAM